MVGPRGADEEGCGSTRRPCATLRHALELQAWRSVTQVAPDEVVSPEVRYPSIMLLDGVFSGEGNRNLQLHGVPVHIRSLRGPSHSTIDCTDAEHAGEMWGVLIERGESEAATLSGLTLRKCLTEAQTLWAVASHPRFAAHVAGPARWPRERRGAEYRGIVWVT